MIARPKRAHGPRSAPRTRLRALPPKLLDRIGLAPVADSAMQRAWLRDAIGLVLDEVLAGKPYREHLRELIASANAIAELTEHLHERRERVRVVRGGE